MRAIKQYFQNIKNSVWTVFDGMTVTFSYLFQGPITVQYPNRLEQPIQKVLPEHYRGFLQVDHETCTSCEACAKACPIDCISLDGVKVPERKGKAPYFFYINLAKCMFCGLCVEPCPSDSIYFTREFEGSSEQLKDLIFSYIPNEVSEKYIKQSIELEKDKAAKAKEKGQPKEKNKDIADKEEKTEIKE